MATERRRCLGTLGLEEGASEDEIKKAYKKMALQYHPDKNASEDAKGKFQEIGYAYKYLTEGPNAFETMNPHDFREELLRRMFDEMFFAPFHGGFHFFCDDNSDDDDYYMYHDDSSDDNTYYHAGGTNDVYGHTRRAYQNTYPRQTNVHQNYPEVSKKQIRKREKRQRQKERAKERKEQGKKEKKEANNVYTDDINTETKHKEKKTESSVEDKADKVFEVNPVAGNSRPDTPVLNQQNQKPNKKLKKKIESEQRKREKEMEEIAAELRKNQERQMEKQKEKERITAQKKEEEKENEINFNHFFDTGKKSRKARQREKKRQESGAAAGQRDSSSSYVPSENKIHHSNSHTNSTSYKKKIGAGKSKAQEQKKTTRKPAMPGNRFDILDDIEDDITVPLSRTSISSNESVNNSYASSEQYFPSSGGIWDSEPSFSTVKPETNTNSKRQQQNYNGFSEQRFTGKTEQFKNHSFHHTNMNQNNSNSNRLNYVTSPETIEISNQGCARYEMDLDQNRKNMHDSSKVHSLNESHSNDINNEFDMFDGEEERHFVEDWSVYQSDEEDYIDDKTFSEGQAQSGSNQNGGHYGYGSNYNPDKLRNGNNSGDGMYQSQGYQRRKEFIPRTRGYQGPRNDGSYYSGPQQWIPPYPRGSAPFTRGGEGRYPQRHPHFRGGYQGMPPFRGRDSGYSGPRYHPPFGMPAYGYRHPFESSVPFGGFSSGRGGNFTNDMKKNNNIPGNNRKNFSPNMSFNNNTRNDHDVKNEHIQNEFQPNVVKSSVTASETGTRVSSPQFMSWQNIKDSNVNSHISGNAFCDRDNNQAGSSGSLDSLDDFVNYETNQVTVNENNSLTSGNRYSPDLGVDMGLSNYLSKDSLGVPSGMISDSIKNYYK